MKKIYFIILTLITGFALNAQPLKLKTLTLESEADCQIGFSKQAAGFSLNEMRMRATLKLNKGIQLVTIFKSTIGNKSWYDLSSRNNRFSQIYAQYSNIFKVFKKDVIINTFAGKLEYYPDYTDARFYYDNVGRFTSPPSYIGADIKAYSQIIKRGNLDMFADITSGDLLGGSNYSAMINEFYVSYTPKLTRTFLGHTKVGTYTGGTSIINEAYISFEHKFKSITPIADAGRLPGNDISPFGFRLGAKYTNKYFMVGGFFEQRLGIFSNSSMNYYSIFFTVLKPKFLASILRNGTILYEPGTQSIKFKLPINFNLNF